MFVPEGRASRTIVVVGSERTATTDEADLFLQLKPGSDFEALWALRALVKGRAASASVEAETGVGLAAWNGLVARLKACQFGVLFFDPDLAHTPGGHFIVGAIHALITELNALTHFVTGALEGAGNAPGAENVLAWQAGYPSAVNFGSGYPRHNPGEFGAADVLARGEADAALVVGEANFPPQAQAQLNRIPTIVIGPQVTKGPATVAVTTATPGIHTGGTVYRMDDVPLSLRPILTSPYPSDEAVLRALLQRLA
jgi:formylmethanofuran dehydrogenase subunit B